MTNRYDNRKIIHNNNGLYYNILEGRGLSNTKLVHYNISKVVPLSQEEVDSFSLTGHIWQASDTLYKLSHLYYGSIEYWWIIAWFNQKPTDYNIELGDSIWIPFPLEEAILLYKRRG